MRHETPFLQVNRGGRHTLRTREYITRWTVLINYLSETRIRIALLTSAARLPNSFTKDQVFLRDTNFLSR